jgi:hypothetical protein
LAFSIGPRMASKLCSPMQIAIDEHTQGALTKSHGSARGFQSKMVGQ